MNHAEALQILRRMMFNTQKARSNLLETLGDNPSSQRLLAQTNPWLFGPKSILPSLAVQIQLAERGGPIAGYTLSNLMWIATKFEPIIGSITITPLPEPRIEWAAEVWYPDEATN